MTRKLLGFWQLEALESRALLGPVPTVSLAVRRVSLPIATVVSATPTNVSATPGGVYGTVVGRFGHAAGSLPVRAQGTAALLGNVNVKGEITLSGPNSNLFVNGQLTLTGGLGTLKIQVQASNAVMTPEGLTASTTETVLEATRTDRVFQGGTGTGSLELRHGTRTFHMSQGRSVPANKFFSLAFTLNPPSA